MPVDASELVFYGSATMADDDAVNQIGGAIDATVRMAFTPLPANGKVEVLSDNAGDNQNVTVTGLNAAGEVATEVKALNGLTVVLFATVFERIRKVEIVAGRAGDVTVRREAAAGDLVVMENGVNTIRRPFFGAAADKVGGAARTYFEKIFVKNLDAVLSLTSAKIALPSDFGGKVTFDLEAALNGADDNGAGNNRQVDPGGYAFDGTQKNVANSGNHTALAAQGIWMKLSLAAGDAPTKGTMQIEETGDTV